MGIITKGHKYFTECYSVSAMTLYGAVEKKNRDHIFKKVNQLKHTTYASVINKNVLFLSVMQVRTRYFKVFPVHILIKTM